ncbi:MAG TPA: alternative ribosome rescue aminoacyl-tRNA hydrolase ArfB [Edaphocola sp.]|nr:alternative ribosome rescue aminoacyl-tRNA hydrolase ArfB [Edaphocola sp.]
MRDFTSEIIYKTARSGGKGGQNVNKVETMVEARWKVSHSALFSEQEKAMILQHLSNRINAEGWLIVRSSASRSQLENKEDAAEKMLFWVNKALIPKKPRIATKPSKAAKERRLEDKKYNAQRKASRRKDWW